MKRTKCAFWKCRGQGRYKFYIGTKVCTRHAKIEAKKMGHHTLKEWVDVMKTI